MLNLLFISDSPKAEYIKSALQPVLKVIIDIVTDFDSGLKDVFEKRPGTVCIQDQIGGVTGESVARHIQMLLGNSAPTFILLHTGTGKAKAIKGLYEHAIDLSRSNETLVEDMKNTLKLLLGDQWEKICIPPKSIPASVRLPEAGIEESRGDAAKLVDDFLSDLEISCLSAADGQSSAVSAPDTILRGPSISVPSATPPLVAVQKTGRDESPEAVSSRSAVTPTAADFRVMQNPLPTDEQIPEDMFLEFEEKYRSESLVMRLSVVIALVLVVLVAGGWYVVVQKPQLAGSLKKRFMPPTALKQVPATAPVAMPVQNPVSVPVQQPVMKPSLPAFIPKDGHDDSFAVKNPGWERYVGKLNEYRVFSASGHMQAVQVLALKEAPVPESLIKSVLQEFTGSAAYQLTSKNSEAGVLVERGRIDNKGEIVIYRKNGDVKAFVVSVN